MSNISNWQKIRSIGNGGFGYVDLYRYLPDNQLYAVKFMRNVWEDDYYQRFVKEIQILENLQHPNIIKLYSYNIQSQHPCYVMPFYEKGSMRSVLEDFKQRNLQFTPKAATAIVLIIAEAMQYAHSCGTIHRDLKPDNILFNGYDPIIADWGIGKFIHYQSVVLTNQGIGTPHYCSPEQWRNDNTLNHRTDIYALGVIFR